jgi:hypothetical protein
MRPWSLSHWPLFASWCPRRVRTQTWIEAFAHVQGREHERRSARALAARDRALFVLPLARPKAPCVRVPAGGRRSTPLVMIADVRDSNERVLADSRFGDPSWAPNGREIALLGMTSPADPGLFFVNPDGSGLRRVATTAGIVWSRNRSPPSVPSASSRSRPGRSALLARGTVLRGHRTERESPSTTIRT